MVSGRFSGHHPFPPGQAFCCAWSAPSSLLWPRRFGDALVSSHSPSSWHHPPKKTDFYGKSIVNPQGNLMSDESTYNLLVIYLFIFCWDDKKNCGQLAIYRWFTSWISRFSVAMLDYQRVYPIFRHTQLVYPAQQKSFLLGSIFPPIFWGPRSICGPRSILGIHSSRVSTCFNFPAEFSMYIYIYLLYIDAGRLHEDLEQMNKGCFDHCIYEFGMVLVILPFRVRRWNHRKDWNAGHSSDPRDDDP